MEITFHKKISSVIASILIALSTILVAVNLTTSYNSTPGCGIRYEWMRTPLHLVMSQNNEPGCGYDAKKSNHRCAYSDIIETGSCYVEFCLVQWLTIINHCIFSRLLRMRNDFHTCSTSQHGVGSWLLVSLSILYRKIYFS